MDGQVFSTYHPVAERIWASIIVDAEGNHELPEAVEKAALLIIQGIGTAKELGWIYGSVYSLYAAMMRKGEKSTADALLRIALAARKLAYATLDSVTRTQEPAPAAPRLEDLATKNDKQMPAFELLNVRRRRA